MGTQRRWDARRPATIRLRNGLKRLAPPRPRIELEAMREALNRPYERSELLRARDGRDVCWPADADAERPLVTVRIATYGRGSLVVDRAVRSALRQTYDNLEVLVVGDGAGRDTVEALAAVDDPRVRFVNLGRNGPYPADPRERWLVAGCRPMNVGTALAAGAWIAPCDDDDELTDDHVEVLLDHARRERLELVWSRARQEVAPGRWQEVGREPLEHGHIAHGTVLMSAGLRFMTYSPSSYRRGEPFDWNLWRRCAAIGVHTGFLDRVTYTYHLDALARGGLRPA